MKTKILFLALLLVTGVFAQQDAQYTQYMYNTLNVNPAYTGTRGVMSVFALHRTQWVGLEGAPVTNTASISSPIENSKFGIGLSIINDRIGISDENNIAGDIAYTIQTSADYKLSFGLKLTANLLSADFGRLRYINEADRIYYQQFTLSNKFSGNIGAGIYYFSDKMYFGLSVPQFLETKHYKDDLKTVASEKMHYYFIAGRVFDITDNVKLKPSLLTKLVSGAPLQVDLSANFMINEKFHIGGAYRWSAALSAMVGFQIDKSWFIGYGYDRETTNLSNYNSGSHEIFLRYELFKNYDKIISPRFF